MTCPQCEQYRVAIKRAMEAPGLAESELEQVLSTGVAFDAPLPASPPSTLQTTLTWILVSERLPDHSDCGDAFLCHDADTGRVDRCVWVEDISKWHDGDDLIEPDEYTHWAKVTLPAPPLPASEEGEG